MSDSELADKFRQCAAWVGLAPARSEHVLELVWRIEDLPDVRELTRLLRREPG